MNSTSDALSLRTRKTKTQKLPGKKKLKSLHLEIQIQQFKREAKPREGAQRKQGHKRQDFEKCHVQRAEKERGKKLAQLGGGGE